MTTLGPHRSWSWPTRVGVATAALALVVMLGRIAIMTPSAEAHADATFTLLHSFSGGADGATPEAGLVRDAAGNLYGTTFYGGVRIKGTVFKLDTTGTETVLYEFIGGVADGANPYAGLVKDPAGNLYGTTYYGGSLSNCYKRCGTVFKVDTTGAETVLHAFTGFPDGANPYGGMVRDQAGNFYGTTSQGGGDPTCNAGYGCGTVFKLDTTSAETVLYSFTGGADGNQPFGTLMRDSAGNFYGTTYQGGGTGCASSGCGTVFKLDPSGHETVLYRFAGGTDGRNPYAGLVRDPAGNLYGTTYYGGSSNYCYLGCGTVFKLDTTGAETILHSFGAGATDGRYPYAGLIRDAAGNLYGTTRNGGSSHNCPGGCGTVFKVDTAGGVTLQYSFRGGTTDGAFPEAGLVRDSAGNLYGTTSFGGAFAKGTIFKLSR